MQLYVRTKTDSFPNLSESPEIFILQTNFHSSTHFSQLETASTWADIICCVLWCHLCLCQHDLHTCYECGTSNWTLTFALQVWAWTHSVCINSISPILLCNIIETTHINPSLWRSLRINLLTTQIKTVMATCPITFEEIFCRYCFSC